MISFKRSLVGIICFVIHASAFAQICVDTSKCKSQLLRVEVQADVINQRTIKLIKPGLEQLAASPQIATALQQQYKLDPVIMPINKEKCLEEKYPGVDCSKPDLCLPGKLSTEVREELCFKLPCAIIKGENAEKCDDAGLKDVYPTQISFIENLNLKKLKLEPTKEISFDKSSGRAKVCLNIKELSLSLGIKMDIDQLANDQLAVKNIQVNLDQPRKVCVSAKIDLASPNPVSAIVIENSDEVFVSDEMIRAASQNLNISGLSGYSPQDLKQIQAELVPVIAQPLRHPIEREIQKSLASVFEKEVRKITDPITSANGGSSAFIASRDFMSELGLANAQVQEDLARAECGLYHGADKPVPPHEHFEGPFTGVSNLTPVATVANTGNLTSMGVKRRLEALRPLILLQRPPVFNCSAGMDPAICKSLKESSLQDHRNRMRAWLKDTVDPTIQKIEQAQVQSKLYDFMEIQNQLQSNSTNLGVSLPEICSVTNPSSHANIDRPQCPIQVYMDLKELNTVLKRLWETGRLCMRGKKSECVFEKDGMGCKLAAAPQIKHVSGKYSIDLDLKKCSHNGLWGAGKFGGDFKGPFQFTPTSCGNGDFCIENLSAALKMVPGTGSGLLAKDGFLSQKIQETIRTVLDGTLKNSIRIPMGSAADVGPLASVPLESAGKLDFNGSYIGACLKPKDGR